MSPAGSAFGIGFEQGKHCAPEEKRAQELDHDPGGEWNLKPLQWDEVVGHGIEDHEEHRRSAGEE